MKRLTSMDFARGIAVLGMCIFHGFFNNWDFFTKPLQWWGFIVGPIFLILGHSRGFFVMISAAVHMFSMKKSYNNGVKPEKILLKQFFAGLVLWGVGALYNAFFNTWGIIDNWHRNATWDWQLTRDYLYYSEALQNIAIGIFVAAIIFFFMTRRNNMEKVSRNLIAIAATTLVIIFASPYIQLGINTALSNYAGTPIDINMMDPWDPIGPGINRFLQYLIMQVAGREAPIFPMLAYSLVGIMIGYILSLDKPDRKILLKVGLWTSLGLALFGFAWLGLVDVVIMGKDFMGTFNFPHVHPTWFVFTGIGIQMAIILGLLRRVEFNEKLQKDKWLKRSRIIRRWGTIALTVFFFQVFVLGPEKLVGLMMGLETSGFGRHQMNFGWSLLVVVLFVLMMEGIVRLWELMRFIGTFEWMFVYMNALTSGRKIDHLDPLRLKDIIYNVEPISFVLEEKGFEAEAEFT